MRKWSFLLLDSEDRPLRSLYHVTGGNGEIVAQSPLGGSGGLSMDEPVDWMSHRVQAIFHDGDQSWPWATYLFTSPVAHHTAFGVVRYEVGLLTKMNAIAEDTTDGRYSVAAGAQIIPTVVSLIQSTGETRIAVTSSTVTLPTGLTWEPGTSKLTIINDLLQAAGYWGLWCDGSGLFRVEPYIDPASRPVAYRFEHGESSIHYPDWTHTQNLTDVPNKVVAWRDGDDEEPPLVGVATNEDPNSPFSIPNRGRIITHVESGVEAESQAVVDQIAARTLRDLMGPVSRLEVEHGMIPLDPNALVEFIPEDGVRRLATVQRMRINFAWDTDVDAEWREA